MNSNTVLDCPLDGNLWEKSFVNPIFSLFRVFETYGAPVATSRAVTDDITNWVTHRIFSTNE